MQAKCKQRIWPTAKQGRLGNFFCVTRRCRQGVNSSVIQALMPGPPGVGRRKRFGCRLVAGVERAVERSARLSEPGFVEKRYEVSFRLVTGADFGDELFVFVGFAGGGVKRFEVCELTNSFGVGVVFLESDC